MSADLIQAIQSELGGGSLSALAGMIGANEDQTRSGVAAALPVLVGALTRNAEQPGGAEALAGALERDHSQPLADHASSLGGLGGLLQAAVQAGSGGRALDGAGMLEHILGGQKEQAASAISQKSGLGGSQVMQLLLGLAPIVMSALGTMKQEKGLDAGGLTSMLQQQTSALGGSDGQGLLGSLIDPAGDGFGADDVMRVGGMLKSSGMLGKLFG